MRVLSEEGNHNVSIAGWQESGMEKKTPHGHVLSKSGRFFRFLIPNQRLNNSYPNPLFNTNR
jgi:hypothetical protein